jgi:hypothetical protein
MLDAESRLLLYEMKIRNGLGQPGEGLDLFRERQEAAIEISSIQVEIAGGYFTPEDLDRVYPEYTPYTLQEEIAGEMSRFDFEDYVRILNHRKVVIKQVCEDNGWFEPSDNRYSGGKWRQEVKELEEEVASESNGSK